MTAGIGPVWDRGVEHDHQKGRIVMTGTDAPQALADLTELLVGRFDVVDVLHRIAETAIATTGAAAAGIVLADDSGHLRLVAATSDRARLLELFQLEAAQGPCMECWQTGEPVTGLDAEELATRWPTFSIAAQAEGFTALDAFPVRMGGKAVGALNLFHTTPEGAQRPRVDTTVAQTMADLAAISIHQAWGPASAEYWQRQLGHVLDARVALERAKGVLAQAGNTTPEEGLVVLRRYTSASSGSLVEVANALVCRELSPDVVLEHR